MTDYDILTAVEDVLPNLDAFTRATYVLARWRVLQGKALRPEQRRMLRRVVDLVQTLTAQEGE